MTGAPEGTPAMPPQAAEIREPKTFDEMGLRPEVRRAIEEMGFMAPTPVQVQAIPVLRSRRDLLAQAQTGTGKTAAFAIPIIELVDPGVKRPQALIVVPTRELAVQVSNHLRLWLPVIQAMAANSPLYDGQDTGYASWRSVQFSRWPSAGPAPPGSCSRRCPWISRAPTA